MKQIRKLVRNGHSTQITLPTAMLEHLQWRPGEALCLEVTLAGSVELRRPNLADLRGDFAPIVLDATAPGAPR